MLGILSEHFMFARMNNAQLTRMVGHTRAAAGAVHAIGVPQDEMAAAHDEHVRVRRDHGLRSVSARCAHDGGHFSHRYTARIADLRHRHPAVSQHVDSRLDMLRD